MPKIKPVKHVSFSSVNYNISFRNVLNKNIDILLQLLLAQLESELNAGNLTLHKMLFYVRPTLNTMEVLAGAVTLIVAVSIIERNV